MRVYRFAISAEGYTISILQGPEMCWAARTHTKKEKLNFQDVIKSAASAASPKIKIQESRGA